MHGEKLPHDIPKMFRKIRESIRAFPKAALFELSEKGFGSPFEILVGCVLSIRTLDEVSLTAALRLLEKARTPKQILTLTEAEIARLISPCTFAGQKASNLRKIASIIESEHKGRLICEFESLIELPGIGPKCAGLILGIACDTPAISVDVHVHRVTNRWGYVRAPSPEKTWQQLKEKLPRKYWVEINELLVPFGKHICKGSRPLCETCPILNYCEQINVPDAIRQKSQAQKRKTGFPLKEPGL